MTSRLLLLGIALFVCILPASGAPGAPLSAERQRLLREVRGAFSGLATAARTSRLELREVETVCQDESIPVAACIRKAIQVRKDWVKEEEIVTRRKIQEERILLEKAKLEQRERRKPTPERSGRRRRSSRTQY